VVVAQLQLVQGLYGGKPDVTATIIY